LGQIEKFPPTKVLHFMGITVCKDNAVQFTDDSVMNEKAKWKMALSIALNSLTR